VLPHLHRRLLAVLLSLERTFEVIYVDDGSGDDTYELLRSLRTSEPRVGIVRLSRNFGKEAALGAGLQLSRGECIVVLDADLQDPPEAIPQMMAAWDDGFDVVNMRRRSRLGETVLSTSQQAERRIGAGRRWRFQAVEPTSR